MKIAVIGAGKLGVAIVNGLKNQHSFYEPLDIIITRKNEHVLCMQSETLGVRFSLSNAEAVADANVVLLAVKPLMLSSVLEEIAQKLKPEALVISVAAGVSIQFLQEKLGGKKVQCVRAMPNMAASIGESATAFTTSDSVTNEQKEVARRILEAISGCVVEVNEQYLNAVTGVSGSGIAYVYLMMESLIDGGVKMGLPRDVAKLLAVQTFLGAANMAKQSDLHLAKLKDDVTTPAGTTMAGLFVLEQKSVRSALIEAVEKATRRAEELFKN